MTVSPELAHYFLFRFNRQLGTNVQSIATETLDRLQRYRWPGNVRQLQSVIREALIGSTGTALLPEFLPSDLQQEEPELPVSAADLSLLADATWQGLADFVERDFQENPVGLYRRALQQFDALLVGQADDVGWTFSCTIDDLRVGRNISPRENTERPRLRVPTLF